MSIFTTFAKQSMINRLSNPINRNRSAAKISKVMSSTLHSNCLIRESHFLTCCFCKRNQKKPMSWGETNKCAYLALWFFLQKLFNIQSERQSCLHVPSLKANHKCYHELSRPSALKPELPRWGWGRGPPGAMAGICQAFSPGLRWLRSVIDIFSVCKSIKLLF